MHLIVPLPFTLCSFHPLLTLIVPILIVHLRGTRPLPRHSFLFIICPCHTHTHHVVIHLGCTHFLTTLYHLFLLHLSLPWNALTMESFICSCYGVYSPWSHSPSSYTYSLQSHSFGFYPFLSSFTLIVLIFATLLWHSFSSFILVILIYATLFELSSLCLHRWIFLVCPSGPYIQPLFPFQAIFWTQELFTHPCQPLFSPFSSFSYAILAKYPLSNGSLLVSFQFASPSFVSLHLPFTCLKRSVIPDNDHRNSMHLEDFHMLSHSLPAPVWDTPVTPSFGCQLFLPPSTTDLSMVMGVEVVSLAIGATASVGISFRVGGTTRHVVRRFDVGRLQWVRAVAARWGGVESRTDVDSVAQASCVWYCPLRKALKTFSFPVTWLEFDHDYITQEIWIHQESYINSLLAELNMTSSNALVTPLDPSYLLRRESDTHPVIDNLTHMYQCLVGSLLQVDSSSVGGANMVLKPKKSKKKRKDLPLSEQACPMSSKRPSHSEQNSASFPPGKALMWCKPCIFGRQAHLSAPTSMTQGSKLGTKCHECYILGYPAGWHGDHVRSIDTTLSFLISLILIFLLPLNFLTWRRHCSHLISIRNTHILWNHCLLWFSSLFIPLTYRLCLQGWRLCGLVLQKDLECRS